MDKKITLLSMRHARAVGELNAAISQANMEASREGWICDWSIAMNQAIGECREIERLMEIEIQSR